jgi:pilus assembly protein Flp/PilA
MVDPSAGTTMEGAANRVCVRDHADDAAFRIGKDVGLENKAAAEPDRIAPQLWVAAPINLQFYAFGFLDGNLSVPLHIRQSSREIEMLGKFLRDESGATAIEYSLIAGFIALAIIAAVGMTGQRLVALFESLIPALTR